MCRKLSVLTTNKSLLIHLPFMALEPGIMDSKTILEELYKRLLGRGNLIRRIGDCYIDVGEEMDWHRTDTARIWSEVSVVQADTKIMNIAKGWVYNFQHLSPFIEGVVAHSLPYPLDEEIVARLNSGLYRRLDKNPLPMHPELQDLTKEDIEDLFNYDSRWYGVGARRGGELVKVEGYNCRTEFEPVPKELQYMVQLEKNYDSEYAYIVSFCICDGGTPDKSFYKHPDTLTHLESWLTDKLQIN